MPRFKGNYFGIVASSVVYYKPRYIKNIENNAKIQIPLNQILSLLTQTSGIGGVNKNIRDSRHFAILKINKKTAFTKLLWNVEFAQTEQA